MAQRNEAVAYETKGMEGGMDMFEKQFDGVVKVKIIGHYTFKMGQSISFENIMLSNLLGKKFILSTRRRYAPQCEA